MEQKTALLNAAVNKQKEESINRFSAKKQTLQVQNTSQSLAMQKWAQRGEIPIDPNQIKIRGDKKQESELVNTAQAVDTEATKFIKKLMLEENLHLVKMSSKQGKGYQEGTTIHNIQSRMKGQGKDNSDLSAIDLLSLKINNKPKD